jgi:hypothetical protein
MKKKKIIVTCDVKGLGLSLDGAISSFKLRKKKVVVLGSLTVTESGHRPRETLESY